MRGYARYLLWAAVVALPLFAHGCGAKGDLYLPDQNQAQERTS